MAKRKASDNVKIADEVEETEETQHSQEESNGLTKMEMVIAALDDGHQTAKTGIPFLDKRFPGHGISPSYFSICKSNHLKKQDGGATPQERTPSAPASNVRDLPASFGRDMVKLKELIETAGGSDELKDLFNAIGDLQERYGLKNINQMIDALS